jgi:nucleoside-diphosphate-sugar epimerase
VSEPALSEAGADARARADGVALVTGGSGYFGSRLVDVLRQRGYRCRVFDISDPGDRAGDVEFVRGDVRDLDAVRGATAGASVVFNNVAQVPIAKDRTLFQSVNVLGTEHVLRAAREAGVKKVVHTSSSAVYGAPRALPVSEATPPAPAEAYGRAKADAEALCARYAAEGLDVSIVRPRTILGHGRLGIFHILFDWVSAGANVPVLGRGANLYQFVHADDLAEACALAAARPGATSYNIGTDRFGTMRELLEGLIRHAGSRSRVRSVPMVPAVAAMRLTGALGLSPLGPYHALMYGRAMYFDVSKAERELGWRARFGNDEMIAESYDWFLVHRAMLAGGLSSHRSPLRQGILALVKRLL